MTASPERHVDVGAYLLGVLGDADRAAFERHLRSCPACTAEVRELGGLEPLLAEYAAHTAYAGVPLPAAQPEGAAGDPPLLDRLLDDVSAARRRSRHRRLLAVAAAAVLVVGGPVAAATLASGPRTTVAATSVLEGEQHTATNAATGVVATVGLTPREWGTDVGLRLTGVQGPRSCDLVAVSRSGERQVVMTWLVPDSGYGVAGAPEPLLVHGGAGILRADLDHFEVRTLTGTTLVTVPV